MSDDIERPPWWLSGDGEPSNEGSSSRDSGASWDMTSMLGMVTSMAGQWWASSGASEHATHGDPVDHPECVICKGLVVLGTATATATPPAQDLAEVRWLPIRRA